jgi:hypothetical protein
VGESFEKEMGLFIKAIRIVSAKWLGMPKTL